jgi:hypothetical protein
MKKLFSPEKITLHNHPEISEKIIQEKIAEDPAIIGLGDLILKDKERMQPRSGRLDLLMQHADTNRRYEIEIQLGKTDENHIIRTLEYWDIEKKRYPQYDHCAVIIAEDITSRFLNIISLFNGFIPLIAIQMNAFKFEDEIALVFTKVLDEMPLGLVDEDEEVQAITDREYWLKRATEKTVKMADELLDIINSFKPGFTLKYNKFYIGLAKDGQPNNWAVFRPKKGFLRFDLRLPKSQEIDDIIGKYQFDEMEYDSRSSWLIIRINPGGIKKHEEMIKEFFIKAESDFNS